MIAATTPIGIRVMTAVPERPGRAGRRDRRRKDTRGVTQADLDRMPEMLHRQVELTRTGIRPDCTTFEANNLDDTVGARGQHILEAGKRGSAIGR